MESVGKVEIQPVAALDALIREIGDVPKIKVYGRVTAVLGMLIEVGGAARAFSVGDRCTVVARDGHEILCEVIGFRSGGALLMPFQPLEGIGLGCQVYRLSGRPAVRPRVPRRSLGRSPDACRPRHGSW